MFDLEEVSLTVDEREAVRLADLDGLSHAEAGRHMGVSRATFGRIVQGARKVIADAMINGKAVKIEGGNYHMMVEIRNFICHKCEHTWEEPFGTGRQGNCPACKNKNIQRAKGNQE